MLEIAKMEQNLPDLPLFDRGVKARESGAGIEELKEIARNTVVDEVTAEHKAALAHLDMHATKWWFGTHNTHIVSDEDIEEQKERIDFFIAYIDHLSVALGIEQGIMDWDTIIHFMENKYIF